MKKMLLFLIVAVSSVSFSIPTRKPFPEDERKQGNTIPQFRHQLAR